MLIALCGFAVLLFLILIRVPLALAMGFVGIIGFAITRGLWVEVGFWDFNWTSLTLLSARTAISITNSYELSVIPLFILMGDFVSQGGLSRDLYRMAYSFAGHLKGGLALSTIIACGIFSSVCGSSLATTATMSKVAYPEMKRLNYQTGLASASIAAGSTLGILIPPSVILIIYGLIAQQSIRELFVAGFFPGLLGLFLYLVAVRYVIWKNPQAGPTGEKQGFRVRWRAMKNILATLFLFTLIMGGIYGGVFTPTEGAGIGAFGGFLIALYRRTLTIPILVNLLKDSAITSTRLFSLLIGSMIFSRFINRSGIVEELTSFIQNLSINPYLVIMMMMFIYIILGMILESLSMILLTVPLFFPIVELLGFDLVWFGIMVVVVTEISLITPPVGLNVFVMSSVMPHVTPKQIFRGVTPFWIADIIRLIILLAIPTISLWLPSLMYN